MIVAIDQVAASLSLQPGMAVAQALTIMPGLQVMESEPEEDQKALRWLAQWCHRISPLVSTDGPDSLWLDVTGCAHLFGNEAALLDALVGRFRRDGLHAHMAVADTPGAAHAMARYAAQIKPVVVESSQHGRVVAELPVAALRLPLELVGTLQRLGFEKVQHLSRIPRALIATRFGVLLGLRLDQVQGLVQESLVPLTPKQALQHRMSFLEPFLSAEALGTAIEHLLELLCGEMERQGLGARQLDLLFERVDGHTAAIRVGTARPSRNVPHLMRLLHERLETVDPGLGVAAMRLIVPLAEPLQWEQQEGGTSHDVARLVDRLVNRLGPERVYRASPRESALPELCVCHKAGDSVMPEGASTDWPKAAPISTTAPSAAAKASPPVLVLWSNDQVDAIVSTRKMGHLRLVETTEAAEPPIFIWRRSLKPRAKASDPVTWPVRLKAPSRLLEPPRPIKALAELPNQPPFVFTWRRRRHRIQRAEGPERIRSEWWRHNLDRAVRDYFQVEDENGQRFWIFRQGDGVDPRTGDLCWFLHGLF